MHMFQQPVVSRCQMISDLFGKYKFGATHTANITPGKVVICSGETLEKILLEVEK